MHTPTWEQQHLQSCRRTAEQHFRKYNPVLCDSNEVRSKRKLGGEASVKPREKAVQMIQILKARGSNIIDRKRSFFWTYKPKHYIPPKEIHAFVIQEQEITTKSLINKRDKDTTKAPSCDKIFWICYNTVEIISHISGNYLKMSTRHNLPLR